MGETQQEKEYRSEAYFIYGSLRQGEYNHRFIAGKSILKGVDVIRGYDLYSLGDFPGIMPSDNPQQTLVGEVVVFTDKDVEDRITRMEKLAGYEKIETVTDSGTKVSVFVYTNLYNRNLGEPLTSGDWAMR